MEALDRLYNALIERNQGDIFSYSSLGDLVCVYCEERLEAIHLNWREKNFQARLVRLLGWEGWEEV